MSLRADAPPAGTRGGDDHETDAPAAPGYPDDDDDDDDYGSLLIAVVQSGPRGWERPDPDDPFRVAVTLSRPVAVDVSVQVTTVDGTAVAPADYVAVDDRVSVRAGAVAVEVPIQILDDRLAEPQEWFEVRISFPSAGRTGVDRVELTIDDGSPDGRG